MTKKLIDKTVQESRTASARDKEKRAAKDQPKPKQPPKKATAK